jgi:hypothetical protein
MTAISLLALHWSCIDMTRGTSTILGMVDYHVATT